ncbi:hypothetical protein AWC38_SpisGene945 [Stylophora pistillata]|uniref:Uncharacterized protein n=1 Tax=Stylophora pistillata TaxID=50429 RepID=A0A2B4SW74_STYPI|nr:hypothetical protein AWC38_SpisGene945 [Stylophora pistillata]
MKQNELSRIMFTCKHNRVFRSDREPSRMPEGTLKRLRRKGRKLKEFVYECIRPSMHTEVLLATLLCEEEDLDEHFREAAADVQPLSVTFPHCPKKCKSKSGLKHHITVKHKDKTEETETDEPENRDLLTVERYASIVANAKVKLGDKKIYPKANRDKIWSYNCNTLQSSTPKFPKIQGLYIQLTKSGNAERFYAAFYASIVLHASSHFVTLLHYFVQKWPHCKEKAEPHACEPLTKLSDKEKSGLQYIGGYVLHKLHNKHKQASKTLENDHAISLIMAGKWDNPIGEDQRLTTTLNRGGLWKITRNAQSVFERTEHYFREATRKTSLKNIPLANIISRSMHDVTVVASHSAMLADSEVEISSHVAKDVLHNIISLYVRVRSFSFVKDVIQKHKIRLKQLKSKALRKDINRSSTD